VYVVGTTVTDRGNDILVLKFDPAGTLLWQKAWGGTDQDFGASVAIGPEDAIYVAGTSGFDAPQAVLVRFDPEGNVVWQRSWTRNASATAKALAVDGDGNVFLAGTSPRPDFFTDTVLVKFSPEGGLLAATSFSAGEIADPEGVAVGGDGTVYIVGALDGSAAAFVVRLNPDLTLDWARDLDGRSGERANSVAVAGDGTIWIVGSTNTADASDEAFFVQMSDRGRVLQAHTWGGAGIEHGLDLGFAADGSLVVGAVAEAEPRLFLKSRLKAGRVRGSVTAEADKPAEAIGTAIDIGGAASVANGSTEYAGSTDAAVLRIAP
jgi:hypothetical protein